MSGPHFPGQSACRPLSSMEAPPNPDRNKSEHWGAQWSPILTISRDVDRAHRGQYKFPKGSGRIAQCDLALEARSGPRSCWPESNPAAISAPTTAANVSAEQRCQPSRPPEMEPRICDYA